MATGIRSVRPVVLFSGLDTFLGISKKKNQNLGAVMAITKNMKKNVLLTIRSARAENARRQERQEIRAMLDQGKKLNGSKAGPYQLTIFGDNHYES